MRDYAKAARPLPGEMTPVRLGAAPEQLAELKNETTA